MIIFKKIRYKNFLSTGNTPIEIELGKSPTTLVIGKNGSGKSTLLDALCWALFNKPFRIIKKEQMINTINNSDCEVEIEFDVGTKQYRVKRSVKPNLFEIYENGQLLNQNASSIDYQKYLEHNIMKLNYRSFIQVVILGSSSYEPFMKMKARYRRDVVEEILDVKVFTQMDLILRDQQGQLSKEVLDVKHKCDLLETKYETEMKHFKSLSQLNTNDIDDKKLQLENLKISKQNYTIKIDNLNKSIEDYNTELEGKEEADNKLKQLLKLETKIEQNIDTSNKSIKFFAENDTCPVCTQSIDRSFREQKGEQLHKKCAELETGIKKLTSEIDKVEERINNFGAISKKLSDLYVDIAKVNTSLEELNNYSDRIHQEILQLENKQTDSKQIATDLQQLKEELETCKLSTDKIVNQKKYVDILREVLSDKGARGHIIKKYVPIINNLINEHLQAMDFFVSFHLDEEFNETVKSRHRDTFNYNSFSEGEKLRIDLAILFTWRTIAKMKNSVNTNLLILDEIFDSSLDQQGTDDFFKIVNKLRNENVFIISHKGDILFDKFTNILKFEKYQNFTRLQNT
jgi:DNA repair exonuclease SbcCD ATPase subunit